MPRTTWPKDVENRILIESRRVCALCFYFQNDSRVKMRGQIAHVDRDASNIDPENGAYLCKQHHDEYDAVSMQSKRLTLAELKEARANLYEFLRSGGLPSTDKKVARHAKEKQRGISLAVYDRRLPIYKATIEFIRYVVQDLRPEYPRIIKFGHDTEEALFLFDEEIAQYLDELSKRAVRLRSVVKMRQAPAVMDNRYGDSESLDSEQTTLSAWFTDQYHETRRRFAPFLRLE